MSLWIGLDERNEPVARVMHNSPDAPLASILAVRMVVL
jgi:hypothetical protein